MTTIRIKMGQNEDLLEKSDNHLQALPDYVS